MAIALIQNNYDPALENALNTQLGQSLPHLCTEEGERARARSVAPSVPGRNDFAGTKKGLNFDKKNIMMEHTRTTMHSVFFKNLHKKHPFQLTYGYSAFPEVSGYPSECNYKIIII